MEIRICEHDNRREIPVIKAFSCCDSPDPSVYTSPDGTAWVYCMFCDTNLLSISWEEKS